jgi:hypothetical protein
MTLLLAQCGAHSPLQRTRAFAIENSERVARASSKSREEFTNS